MTATERPEWLEDTEAGAALAPVPVTGQLEVELLGQVRNEAQAADYGAMSFVNISSADTTPHLLLPYDARRKIAYIACVFGNAVLGTQAQVLGTLASGITLGFQLANGMVLPYSAKQPLYAVPLGGAGGAGAAISVSNERWDLLPDPQ